MSSGGELTPRRGGTGRKAAQARSPAGSPRAAKRKLFQSHPEEEEYRRVTEEATLAKKRRVAEQRPKRRQERMAWEARVSKRKEEMAALERENRQVRRLIGRTKGGGELTREESQLLERILAARRDQKQTASEAKTHKLLRAILRRNAKKLRKLQEAKGYQERVATPGTQVSREYASRRKETVAKLKEKVESDITLLGTPRTRREKYRRKYNVPPPRTPRRTKVLEDMIQAAQNIFNPQKRQQPDLAITPEMVEEAVRARAKKDTAPGPSKIADKDLLAGGKKMFRALSDLYNTILRTGDIPAGFGDSEIALLLKGTNKPAEIISSWRPVELQEAAWKVFSHIVQGHWIGWLMAEEMLSPWQQAFRPGGDISTLLYTLEAALQDARDRKGEIYVLFLDISNAFGSLSHNALRRCLSVFGVAQNTVRVIEERARKGKILLRSAQGESSAGGDLDRLVGLPQGDPLAPIVFALILDIALRGDSKSPMEENGLVLRGGNAKLSHLDFADDVGLTSGSRQGVQSMATWVEKRFQALNLTLSPDKIALLAYKFGRELTPITPDPPIQIDGKPIRCAGPNDPKPLVYLGATINRPGSYAELRQTGWLSPKHPLDETLDQGLRPLQEDGLLQGLTFPQKLDYVTTYVVPKLQYPLRVATVRVKELDKVDSALKEAVKSWAGVPVRTSDAFLYLPRHRLGMGLPSFRHLYRKALIDKCGRLLGIPTKATSPIPPLAGYTRPILIQQIREYLDTGLVADKESPVLGLKMTSTNKGSLPKKSGREAKGEKPWLAHMLGGIHDAKLGLHLDGDRCYLTDGPLAKSPKGEVMNGFKTLKGLRAYVTRVSHESITEEHLRKHPPAAPLLADAREGHVAIAKLLSPTTTRDVWRWGRREYARYIHQATYRVAAKVCGPCVQGTGLRLRPTQTHYVAGCEATNTLQIARHHAVCDNLAGVCREKGFLVEREKAFPQLGRRADLMVRTRRGVAILEIAVVEHFTPEKFAAKGAQIAGIAREVAKGELTKSDTPQGDDDIVDRLFQWGGEEAPKAVIGSDGREVKGWIWVPGTGELIFHATRTKQARGRQKTPAAAARGILRTLIAECQRKVELRPWTRVVCIHNVPSWSPSAHRIFEGANLRMAVAVYVADARCTSHMEFPGTRHRLPDTLPVKGGVRDYMTRTLGLYVDYPRTGEAEGDLGNSATWAHTYTTPIPVLYDVAGTLHKKSATLLQDTLGVPVSAALRASLEIYKWNYIMGEPSNIPQWYRQRLSKFRRQKGATAPS
ncbi:Hypp2170 [Branchiostoma lanceolatum]|uniref:Hypp2170 protein n=1 Tax=Branchiostoma lanceolatum TaxID=7740 RepID=A0A8J9ZS62_BRALA|nr:Hypp2170 [Branchiostoma lanceolatum]